jgi:hypothetical protein
MTIGAAVRRVIDGKALRPERSSFGRDGLYASRKVDPASGRLCCDECIVCRGCIRDTTCEKGCRCTPPYMRVIVQGTRSAFPDCSQPSRDFDFATGRCNPPSPHWSFYSSISGSVDGRYDLKYRGDCLWAGYCPINVSQTIYMGEGEYCEYETCDPIFAGRVPWAFVALSAGTIAGRIRWCLDISAVHNYVYGWHVGRWNQALGGHALGDDFYNFGRFFSNSSPTVPGGHPIPDCELAIQRCEIMPVLVNRLEACLIQAVYSDGNVSLTHWAVGGNQMAGGTAVVLPLCEDEARACRTDKPVEGTATTKDEDC